MLSRQVQTGVQSVKRVIVRHLSSMAIISPQCLLWISVLGIMSLKCSCGEMNTALGCLDDVVPPTIQCPDNIIRTFTKEDETVDVVFSANDLISLSDNSGEDLTQSVTFTPPQYSFVASQNQLGNSFPPSTTEEIIAQVTDSSQNSAQCQFQLHFQPESCSPFTLRTPIQGDKTCTETSTGSFRCTLTCDSGYRFYSDPSTNTLTYNCNQGDTWVVPETLECVRVDDQNQEARFRQKFRFTYILNTTEGSQCNDLGVYRTLLSNTLDESEQQLPGVCNLDNPNLKITGQLTIEQNDIARVGNTILINVTLTWDKRPFSIYDVCGNIMALQYGSTEFDVTKPFLNGNLKPLNCPAISTTNGAEHLSSTYFCEDGKKVSYQAPGSNTARDVCILCPEGTRTLDGSQDDCQPCSVGSFSATPGQTNCSPCSTSTSTLRSGATSIGECTAMCPSGSYSSNGLRPCIRCPKDSYSNNNSTFCTRCQTGYITRQTGATSVSQCLPPCPLGTYNLVDGHGEGGSCKPCPLGFFANETGSMQCRQCSSTQVTLQEGSTNHTDCVSLTCDDNPCQSGGTCNVFNHHKFCNCADGYNGQNCENRVDPCSSSPCYYGGTCSSSGLNFTCSCPTGSGGDRCQTLVTNCFTGSCENGAACRNDLNQATCLCLPGFSGNSTQDRCQFTSQICTGDKCSNGGTCVSLDNVRHRCQCPLGYTGDSCETNIDDCASNPCLHGANCTDLLNNFRCACPTGFTGSRCEQRLNLCSSAQCDGQCVEDFEQNTYRCVCPQGKNSGRVCQFEAYFGLDINGSTTWAFESATASIQECLDQCQQRDCTSFFHSNATGCRIVARDTSISTQLGQTIYYYKQCISVEAYYYTPWYSSYVPDNGFELEDLDTLNNRFGLNICGGRDPIGVECRPFGNLPAAQPAQAYTCSPSVGLVCDDSNQAPGQTCQDYEVRFKCLSVNALPESPCTDINYCSNSSVCSNGGVCSETATGPACNCPGGYTGSRCQHDVDDCASGPCKNGGTCQDGSQSFQCQCPPGFTGSTCLTNINECASNPCNALGTDECRNLDNRYECACKPGYTGDRCETDIDDCASQPCLHSGTCTDRVNNFTCSCADGWSGAMCEDLIDTCQADTCDRGAACHDLFNDFYCRCLPNTYGKTCSNGPSICTNANPCIHQGNCSEERGQASCDCPREYEGDGCQIRKDACDADVCLNGASCSTSLDGFMCHCAEGYTGRYCEVNIDDCAGVTCHSQSSCIDMVNEHFCQCPVGQSGNPCKAADRNFDLLFSKADKTSMAVLRHPVPLRGDGFSITMWIQYSSKGGTGTFFTLYQVSDSHSLSNKQELIRLDEKGVTISLSGSPRMVDTTVDYNMDGEWHYIVLTWNKTSGLLGFFVDTIRIPLPDYNKDQPLDLDVWMVLGCHYDPASDSCLPNQGFNGLISQVSLYHRELLFDEELTVRGNRDPYSVFTNATMLWGQFVWYPCITRIYPSFADQTCPVGFTNFPGCTQSVSGKTRVRVDQNSCPNDVIIYGTERVTTARWNSVTFSGQANLIQKSLQSGTPFIWGKYPVIMEASNADGNKALCVFDIYIQYRNCTTPETPQNTDRPFCANSLDTEGRRYRQCAAGCNSGYEVVVPSPKIHTCGPVGDFDPPNRYLPYTLPHCGASSTPKRRLVVVIRYRVSSTECAEVEQDLIQQIRGKLVQENVKWSSGLCKLSTCQDIQLSIQCQSVSSRRRKRQATIGSDVAATITLDDMPKELTLSADPRVKRSPEDLLRQLVWSDDVFDFNDRIAGAIPDPNGLEVRVDLLCQAPTTLIDQVCVECSAGSYYDNTTNSCALCAIGSYQPDSGKFSCIGCSTGLTTQTVGSVLSSSCKSICPVGEYYNNGCSQCEQGFYQDTPGLFHCLPCPVDKTTRTKGATSSSQCFNDCPAGQELTTGGACNNCSIGTYKPAGQTLCGSCDSGLVTNKTGATSKSDCNVADNQAGTYRTRPDETKSEQCPIGTYQPEIHQYSCIDCGGANYRTDTMGSTKKSDCKFFCPAGQEKVDGEDRCIPCGIGFYRTGDNPYSECERCPNNTRTPSTGSINVSACSIYKCSAGYRPVPNQEDCEKCPRGSYQPVPNEVDCIQCVGARVDTRSEGSTEQSQCEQYCDSGSQKFDNGSCIVCPIGYYKDNSIDNFHNCTRCSDTRFVTPREGATSDQECTVLDCPAGFKIDGSVCVECPQGSYQEQPYMTQCDQCPVGQSTRRNGSTSSNECETYCIPGEEKPRKEDQCQECARGFYKNNDVNVFMNCTECDPRYVTQGLGSTSDTQCTIRNCTEGQYTVGDDCRNCQQGYYQPNRWQATCIKCGTDKTTPAEGAVNETQCILSCPPGKENRPGSDNCTDCQQGYYKTMEKADVCDKCRDGFVTRINGSMDPLDCNLRACEAGSYADDSSSTGCATCAVGYYQPNKWQEQCIPCDTGYTTFRRGADTKDLCLKDCPPGYEYSTLTKDCQQCPIGYYNDDLDPYRFECIICPAANITRTEGSKSATECNIANCTKPGQYRDAVDNVCRNCPKGSWQNQKWLTTCQQCASNQTTKTDGSVSSSDCLFNCPRGQYFDESDASCKQCAKGSYRQDTWDCQPCSDGLTTVGTGATSSDECSVSTCLKGNYFDKDGEMRCRPCSQNSYQDEDGKFQCKNCQDRTQTLQTGADRASLCIDKCSTSSNTCEQNATCLSAVEGVTCQCKTGYQGKADGTNCIHICDVKDYCINSESCDRQSGQCICKPNYEGSRCDLRQAQSTGLSDKDVIIVAVVTTLAFLAFLILLIVCCCLMARRRQRNHKAYPHETSDERASIATRMSTKGYDDFGYPTKASSLNTSRMMLPAQNQQMYENPVFNLDPSSGDPAVYKA